MELKEYRKLYYEKNKERIKEQNRINHKIWYEKHKEEKQMKNKEWIKNNLERRKEYLKKWEKDNHDKIIKRKLERRKQRRKEDYIYKLKEQARDTIKKSFRGILKGKRGRTKELLGCDLDFFVNYLLDTYKNNYSIEWNKIEKVHIDHIIPLATAKTEEDVIKLCHYKNLQLLKAEDNLKKNSKVEWRLNNDI